MKQPLFSVLIANYNNGKYLMEAIESVRQQTYTHWEIVLVDDASTDNSKQLYKDLEKDERIHIYYNERNMGCGYTKRRCAELAQGEICGFLDADDALTKDALVQMVHTHLANPNVGLVYSRLYETDEFLRVKGVSQGQMEIPHGSSFLEIGGCAISHFATFKKSDYLRTEGINSGCKRAVDHDLYYKLEEVAPLLFIDVPLYYYRMGTGNNISSGIDGNKAFISDIFIMKDAAIRRGINPESVVSRRFDIYVNELNRKAEIIASDKLRMTKTYRLGAIIRAPFTFICSLFSKC